MAVFEKLKQTVITIECGLDASICKTTDKRVTWADAVMFYRPAIREPVGSNIAFPMRRGIWNGLRGNDLAQVES